MDFDYSPKTKELQKKLLQFMDDHIYPAESQYMAELAATHRRASAGRRCRRSRTSRPKPRPSVCGTCSCRWTRPRPQATTARA